MSIENAKEMYPDQFFSILTPTSPWFSVQFRNKITDGDIETSDIWEELSVKQNTFVKSISIEDSGGVKKLTLVLFDQYFSFIENLVMGSIFLTRASNDLYEKELKSITKDDINLDFALSRDNLTNLRIRIGYADINVSNENEGSNYFETIAGGNIWEERINARQTVIRSPWMYFMINGITNEITDDGLQMTITGVSLSSNVLNNLKIVQQFAKMTGKPIDIINRFREILDGVQGSNLKVLPFGSGSEQPEMKTADEEIEIFLGGEPRRDKNNNIITSYKTINEIFNDICSKIPPKNIEDEISNVEQGEEASSSDNYSNYSFFVAIDGAGNENVSFYYPDPKKSSQLIQRVYDWRETPNTIIKSLNIQTATDFAIMSQKLKINNYMSDKREINFLPKKTDTSNSYNPNIGTDKVLEFYDLDNTKPFSFVSDIIDIKESNNSTTKNTYLNQLKNEFVKNINRQVFKGTITIPGDPFYFFDKKVRPFEYFIKLNVMRPGPSGISVKSYLTGNYVVTSITHNIDESGYFTTLGVMRYPLPEEKTKIVYEEQELYKMLGYIG